MVVEKTINTVIGPSVYELGKALLYRQAADRGKEPQPLDFTFCSEQQGSYFDTCAAIDLVRFAGDLGHRISFEVETQCVQQGLVLLQAAPVRIVSSFAHLVLKEAEMVNDRSMDSVRGRRPT